MFTLSDTETDTETDKKWVVKNCVGGSVHTAPTQQCHWVLLQFVGIGVCVCVGVGQCECTIIDFAEPIRSVSTLPSVVNNQIIVFQQGANSLIETRSCRIACNAKEILAFASNFVRCEWTFVAHLPWQTDSDTDSDSNSKPNGYNELHRTCYLCTDLDSDYCSPFF